MPSLIADPAHWRDRAEEARVQAEQMRDADARRQMLQIAEGYDRLAERAQRQLEQRKPA